MHSGSSLATITSAAEIASPTTDPMKMALRLVAIALAVCGCTGQMFGGGSKRDPLAGMSKEEREHMQGTPQGAAAVDRAMQEWDTLASNPEMMQEVLASFKDPEVQAKAKEMINDPEYMAAAKKRLKDMQKKAHAQGLLDEKGNPLPGAATAAGKAAPAAAAMMAMMQQQMQANGNVPH